MLEHAQSVVTDESKGVRVQLVEAVVNRRGLQFSVRKPTEAVGSIVSDEAIGRGK